MKSILSVVVAFLLHISLFAAEGNECDCRDWYDSCRRVGDDWVDDLTWSYSCDMEALKTTRATFVGCISGTRINNKLVKSGTNITVDGFWYSCDANEMRLKYQQEPQCIGNGTNRHVGDRFREGRFQWLCLETGRWVTGCYYQNETRDWLLLNIGETAYNGLIKHSCEKHIDNPGRVQYYAKIRDDVPYKNPPNKGINLNLPEPADLRLKQEPVRWLHENVATFIANKPYDFNTKIRFLAQT